MRENVTALMGEAKKGKDIRQVDFVIDNSAQGFVWELNSTISAPEATVMNDPESDLFRLNCPTEMRNLHERT